MSINAFLSGTLFQRSYCRYGLGAACLHKYGLMPARNLDIIALNESGSASCSGSIGTISWNPLNLRAVKNPEKLPYLIEAWVCQNRYIIFSLVGSYQTAAKITDEPGCSELPYGLI